MIGKVGDDSFGRLLTDTLRKAGIETKGIVSDPDVFTTLAFVSLDASGNRDFSFARKPGADTCLTPEEIDGELLENAKVFHFGTLSLTDSPAADATRRAIELAKSRGLLISLTRICANRSGNGRRTPGTPLTGASGRRIS